MSPRAAIPLACLAMLTAIACGDTGQHTLTVPLFARGGEPTAFDVGDWTVELSDARVGIGPIYFCASRGSSADLCPSAVAELTDSVTLDALDPERTRVGILDALSVEARSAAWDFAITWPRTAPEPIVLEAAPEGHSAHFEGTASNSATSFDFVADLDIAPLLRGTHAVQGVDAPGRIGAQSECELQLEAAAWWSQVDFDALSTSGDSPVHLVPGDRAYEALLVAMTSSLPPTVVWSE